MTTVSAETIQDLDLKILSRCIYELNITRRYILSYPVGHPIIEASTKKTFQLIGKLLETQTYFTIGIARNVLLFNSGVLDRKNPVYNDFAGYLFTYGIATLTILKQVSEGELISFFVTLKDSNKGAYEPAKIVSLLRDAGIRNIKAQSIDYGSFRVSEDETITAPKKNILEYEAAALWGRFVEGVMQGTLDPNGVTSTERIDPERLSAFMDEHSAQLANPSKVSYDSAITSFLRQSDRDNLAHQYDAESFEKLGEFIKNMSPELRTQFLRSSFEGIKGGESAHKLMSQLNDEVIMEALDDVNSSGASMSQGIVNLLQIISRTGKGATQQAPASPITASLPKEELAEKLKNIFREEEPGKYIPDSYRTTLSSIAAIERFSVLTPDESRPLLEQMNSINIESGISNVIINIIDMELELEDAQVLKQNLIDLCEVFLNSGDYSSLANIHKRLSLKCRGGLFGFLPIHEAVLGRFYTEEFHDEILNGLTIWGKNKYKDIKEIITGVGASFIEPLMQRLAEETNMSFRRFYMECLKEIGNEAKVSAIQHLQDKRWYVVRNMVGLLRSFEDPAVVRHFRLIAEHPHPKVRQEVIKTLYAFRHSEADQLLLKEFRSSNHEIVLSAIQLSEHSRSPVVFECLRKIMAIKLLAKAEYELQSAAVKSLGKIANGSILKDFERILGQKSLLAANHLKLLKMDIVRSLDSYPLTEIAPLLDKIEQSDVTELTQIAADTRKRLERAIYAH